MRVCVCVLACVFVFVASCFSHAFPLQSVARADPQVREKDRLLMTLQEEAYIAKDKVKQLSQVSVHPMQP